MKEMKDIEGTEIKDTENEGVESEGHFDLSEEYGSIAEIESDLNKVAKAIRDALVAAHETKLPLTMLEGLFYSALASLQEDFRKATALLTSIDVLSDFLGILNDDENTEKENTEEEDGQ